MSGVKVMTYFMLHIKPSFSTHYRELRELHTLAGVIDTLRVGDLAKAGDALAARFVAIHQSLIDSNWHTARHMEIFPMEEPSAASSALVLATRKHSRDWMKAQGTVPLNAQAGLGRGKGGKGGWYPPSGETQKGEKGKNKKGKTKGKGRGQQEWQSSGDWGAQKEKPDAKAA